MVHGKLTFICGGVRSGKSTFAERLLVEKAEGHRLVYIASGRATDSEMQKRIKQHRIDRADNDWVTHEHPVKLEEVLPEIHEGDVVLWDCLTTWLANELFASCDNLPCIEKPGCMERKEAELYMTIDKLLAKAKHLIIVSNEVFDELPSAYAETELYRMWLGRIHLQLVKLAHAAIEMDYGVATYWKEEEVV